MVVLNGCFCVVPGGATQVPPSAEVARHANCTRTALGRSTVEIWYTDQEYEGTDGCAYTGPRQSHVLIYTGRSVFHVKWTITHEFMHIHLRDYKHGDPGHTNPDVWYEYQYHESLQWEVWRQCNPRTVKEEHSIDAFGNKIPGWE